MISAERLRTYLSRRDILLLPAGAIVASVLSACSSGDGDDDDPTAAEKEVRAASATPETSPTSVPSTESDPSATSIPDLDIADVADDSNLDIVRYEDLNAFGQYKEVQVSDDGTRHLIPLNAIEWGGVARDGIPAIDSPFYVGPDRWYEMVYDPEGLVIGVEVNGKHRAYPMQILIWHEIVNETFDGKHLLVTY